MRSRSIVFTVWPDETVRDPAQKHVYPRVKSERALEHAERPSFRICQQAIDEQESTGPVTAATTASKAAPAPGRRRQSATGSVRRFGIAGAA